MVARSIGQVANYKPLYRCDIEELAAMQQTRPSGGMLFARFLIIRKPSQVGLRKA